MPHGKASNACLAKIDVFKGKDNDQLDTFFNQVEEFVAFFHLGRAQDMSSGSGPSYRHYFGVCKTGAIPTPVLG